MRRDDKPNVVFVSLPKELRRRAERVSARMGVSHGHFYTMAIAEYVARHEPDAVTERLNQVYAKDPAEPDSVLFALAMQAVEVEEW